LQYGFKNLELTEIIGRASILNKSSIKVLEKIQMSFWKTETYPGLGDTVYYRINHEEYFLHQKN